MLTDGKLVFKGMSESTLPVMKIMVEVIAEVERQQTLKAQGRFKHTPADPELGLAGADTVLTEEVGEVMMAAILGALKGRVSHAVKVLLGLTKNRPGDGDLRTELVQVAAVAVAWVEALDKQSTPIVPPYTEPSWR